MEEKYRSQIKELKERMKEASKRASDAERFERLKSRTEETCKRLRDEILEMKQQKVALAKAVEQSHKELNAYKRARDKELMQVGLVAGACGSGSHLREGFLGDGCSS